MLLVQFLVLVFTGVLWWLARRDLASRVAPPMPVAPPADTRELEQLCATLEALVTDLADRLEAVEKQRIEAQPLASALTPPGHLEKTLPRLQTPNGSLSSVLPASVPEGLPPSSPTLEMPEPMAEPENASHASLYALLAEGVTDPAEIARRTGLGRGEVDLILSLRARRAL